MRFFIIMTLFLSCTVASAQAIDQNTINALECIRQGYIVYGFEEFEKAIRGNDVYAQYYLAVCYENGIIVKQNYIEAFNLYRRAAERGLPDAMYHLADLYKKGYGVSANSLRSDEWRKRYLKKGGRLILPDLLDLYNEGIKSSSNYALNPYEGLRHNVDTVSNSINLVNQIINVNTVDKSISKLEIKEESIQRTASDVDCEIPVNHINKENTFVLVIANENYQEVVEVPNALNDGVVFADYCNKTIGVPETNIHLVKNATLNNIKREVDLIVQIAEAYRGEANIIVYYAGHGIPDESSKEAYILPVDGYTSDLSTCYKLNDLYTILGSTPSSQIVIILDACFSGSLRGKGMLASARGIVLRPKQGTPAGNMVVISASQGDETAYPYESKCHGLFTYFLLKKLKESKGNVNLGELFAYIKENVSKKSLVVNGKSQTPTIMASPSLDNKWTDWKL